jgi:hypothetical protein
MAYAEPPPLSEEDLAKASEELEAPDRKTRTHAALAMRLAGANYSEIAEVLGYSDLSRARQAVETAMASTSDDETREKARQLANLRYDRLLRSIWEKATQPLVKDPITKEDVVNHELLAANRQAALLVERQAKLNGAERPTEVINYTPLAYEIQAELKRILEGSVTDLPTEVDIVSSNVIGDKPHGDQA